ncbi:hypothetical protein V3H46_14135 [Vibrio parahaemolyticus]|uniref:hypothetical protein n=1 Tax=Vibrio parahaemolyticus TaxID=670 RepID=UPI003B67D446
MNYIIFPEDPSTKFMNVVFKRAIVLGLDNQFEIISCRPEDSGYKEAIDNIKNIPSGSRVIFIGHSTPNKIYGGQSDSFERKTLLSLDNMSIFRDKELILVSCFSNKLIESSRGHRNYSNCIGFGLLPSELDEVSSHSGMRNLDLKQEDIDKFTDILASIISDSICYMLKHNTDIYELFRYIKVLINKKANDLIINDNDEKLGELLFYVSTETLVE